MDSRHHFADDAYRRLNITRLPKDGLGYLARGEDGVIRIELDLKGR